MTGINGAFMSSCIKTCDPYGDHVIMPGHIICPRLPSYNGHYVSDLCRVPNKIGAAPPKKFRVFKKIAFFTKKIGDIFHPTINLQDTNI